MPKIDNAYFGSISIDGKKYNADLIVSWDGEITEKDRRHNITKGELIDILMKDPEVVIVGTGFAGNLKVDPDAELFAKVEGIVLLTLPTSKAILEFNKLSKKRKTVAVLHITC